MRRNSILHESKYIEWSIKNFFDEPNKVDYKLDSACFSLSDTECFLRIFTNGETTQNSSGYVSIHFIRKESTAEFNFVGRIGIRKDDGTEFLPLDIKGTFSKTGSAWRCKKFFHRLQLLRNKKDIAPNGTLTLFCTLRIMDGPISSSANVESASRTGSDSNWYSVNNGNSILNASKHIEWRIENFFDEPNEVDYILQSPCFSLSDTKFALRICTNGETRTSSSGYISLHLSRLESALEHDVVCRIGIQNKDGAEFLSLEFKDTFSKTANTCGYSKFLQRSQLLKFKEDVAPKGTLTIYCTFRFMDGPISSSSNVDSSPQAGYNDLLTPHRTQLLLLACPSSPCGIVKRKNIFNKNVSSVSAKSFADSKQNLSSKLKAE